MKFLLYTLVRFGIMAVVFVVCVYLQTGLVLAGLFAVLIAFAVSYLAFPKLHAGASRDFGRFWEKIRGRRKPKRTLEDANVEIEDRYVDEQLRREGRDV